MGEGDKRATPVLTRIAGGEMAARVRDFDWSKTSLGARAAWSPALRLAADMILAANFPMALRWGPKLALIYNDAYAPALHDRHPDALGSPFGESPQYLQSTLQAVHSDIMKGASGGFAFENLPLKLQRGGAIDTANFTVTYSPVPDDTVSTGIGGVLVIAVEISETLKTQKSLRDVEERYQMAREVAGVVGAWEWDIKANKVYADARYAELHNVAPEFAEAGLPAQSYTPAVHPDDRTRVRDVALKAAAAGGDFSEEYRLVQTDGATRWVYTRGRAYLGEDGQPERNTGVIIDITERKQVEAELASARLDLDLAAQAAGMGRWVLNPSQGQRYWDDRARAIFGLPAGETPDQARLDGLIHPDDLEAVRAAVVAASDPTGPGTINLDYRIRRDDGVERWVETFGQGFFENGQCVRLVGVVSDVTDRREAVEQLLRQEATLRLAIDAADVGTWDLDVDTGVLTWSDRCYAMFGVKIGEPVDIDTFYSRVHPADVDRLRDAMRQAMDPAIRSEYSTEFRALGRDDHVERWLGVKGKVFFGDDNKAHRFVGAVVNVTDRKRAELHLRLLVNELNHRVKNSLATIQAIAAQSFNGQRSLDQAQEAFSSRIVALAEAHDLLTRENWEGAELHDVASRVASLHGGAGRFELAGPGVRLSPKTALSLSMALHELATNAMKYGALSTPDGRIRVVWDLAPEAGPARLDLSWTERGGPPVTPPTDRGFGSRLIERGLAAELSGSAAIDFQPDGVVCRIRALLEA